MKEHIRATRLQQIDKSSVAEHSYLTKHMIDFDKTKILHREKYYHKRLPKEAIELCRNTNNFNRDCGNYELGDIWKAIL